MSGDRRENSSGSGWKIIGIHRFISIRLARFGPHEWIAITGRSALRAKE